MRQDAFFHDSGVQPLPHQPLNPPILPPLVQPLASPGFVNTVVGRERPRSPLYLSPQVKPGVRISRTGLPMTRS